MAELRIFDLFEWTEVTIIKKAPCFMDMRSLLPRPQSPLRAGKQGARGLMVNSPTTPRVPPGDEAAKFRQGLCLNCVSELMNYVLISSGKDCCK